MAGLVLVFIRRVAGDQLIDHVVKDDSVRPAAHEVWWIATDPLKLATQSILFVGIVGLIGAWIAGDGRRATATRRWLAPYLRDPWIAWGGLAAIVLLLLAWSPTPATRNWVTVTLLTASAALGLEVLRRQARPRVPGRRAGAGLPLTPGPRAAFPAGALGRGSAPRAPRPPRRAARQRRLDEAEFAREKERLLSGAAS